MMRRWTGGLLWGGALMGAGCASSGAETAADSGAASDEITNPSYPVETPSPSLEVQDLANRLDQFVSVGAPTGFSIGESFMAYVIHGNEICPNGRTSSQFEVESCTTEDGWFFEGTGWYSYDEFEQDEDDLAVMSHGGDYRLMSPTGDVMTGGGGIGYELITNDDGIALTTDFQGSYQDSRGEPWLQQGFSAVSLLTAEGPPGEIVGELTGGMSIGPVFLDFSHVQFQESSECSWEPEGTIGIRDDVGYWYTWEVTADCNPCAPVYFAPTGEYQGELCADVTIWFEAFIRLMVPL